MMSLSRVVVIFCLTTAFVSAQSAPPSNAEDFSTASLATSQLHPEPPELVERSEEPGYISEWVTVRWRAEEPIYLYVVRPTRGKKTPVVIYFYDYSQEKDEFRDDDLCALNT